MSAIDKTTKTEDVPAGPQSVVPSRALYPFDPLLFGAMMALVVLGIVMAYSASAVYAAQRYHDSAYFLERDVLYALLGAGAMWFGARTDFSVWKRWAYPMAIIALALLGGVLVIGAR